MLLDALFALIFIKFLGTEALTTLGIFTAIVLIRTCYKADVLIRIMEEEVISMIEEDDFNVKQK
jgi:hypothetical protein